MIAAAGLRRQTQPILVAQVDIQRVGAEVIRLRYPVTGYGSCVTGAVVAIVTFLGIGLAEAFIDAELILRIRAVGDRVDMAYTGIVETGGGGFPDKARGATIAIIVILGDNGRAIRAIEMQLGVGGKGEIGGL